MKDPSVREKFINKQLDLSSSSDEDDLVAASKAIGQSLISHNRAALEAQSPLSKAQSKAKHLPVKRGAMSE